MRQAISAVFVALLLLTACSGGDADDSQPRQDETTPAEASAPPVRGDLEVAVEPMALADLPDTPEPGTGVAVVDQDTYRFVVTFCDETGAIGTGQGEGVEVNWDIRDDGDHRVNVRVSEGDRNWVRGGPAEAEVDAATRTVRFAGAFVPFRAADGSDARSGGVVIVCPEQAGA